MTARKIRIFVSSVAGSLKATRGQIIQDLNKAGYDVTAMERFGAQPTVPLDVCLSELRKSDAVVLLIGPRYGSVLPQGIRTHTRSLGRHEALEFPSSRSAFPPMRAMRRTIGPNSKPSQRRSEAQRLTIRSGLTSHWTESHHAYWPRSRVRETGGTSVRSSRSSKDLSVTSRSS